MVKLTLTRGPGPRGYPPPVEPSLTRIVVSTAQQVSESEAARPLTLRVCETRLGRNPRLAGIKHLNRLEQVLAGAELRDPAVDEGLMRSTDDRIVCATAANVFLVRSGELLTPQISDCGVAGVMREVVLRLAQSARHSRRDRRLHARRPGPGRRMLPDQRRAWHPAGRLHRGRE